LIHHPIGKATPRWTGSQAFDRGDLLSHNVGRSDCADLNRFAVHMAVRARHTPTPHPYFGPVTPSKSCRTHSKGNHGERHDSRWAARTPALSHRHRRAVAVQSMPCQGLRTESVPPWCHPGATMRP